MAIYIEWEGIKGNVTAGGFKDHLAAESVSFGVARDVNMVTGNCANRESTRPSFSPFHMILRADLSITAILKEATAGSEGKKIVIKFVQTGADNLEEYMSYTLGDSLVSDYNFTANAEGEPILDIGISYCSILLAYLDYDASNKGASPQRVGYDLKEGKPA